MRLCARVCACVCARVHVSCECVWVCTRIVRGCVCACCPCPDGNDGGRRARTRCCCRVPYALIAGPHQREGRTRWLPRCWLAHTTSLPQPHVHPAARRDTHAAARHTPRLMHCCSMPLPSTSGPRLSRAGCRPLTRARTHMHAHGQRRSQRLGWVVWACGALVWCEGCGGVGAGGHARPAGFSPLPTCMPRLPRYPLACRERSYGGAQRWCGSVGAGARAARRWAASRARTRSAHPPPTPRTPLTQATT